MLLFATGNTMEDINPYQFVHEDFSNGEADYFFADVIDNWREINAEGMLQRLGSNIQRWERLVNSAEVGPSGELVWQEEGVREYEKLCAEFLQFILIAMNMQCGATGRGEEMVMVTYKNTMDGERNLKVESGQIAVETSYHKSQAIMGSLKAHLS